MLIGIILVLICGLTSTVNLALRNLSYSRLSKVLPEKRRDPWLEAYRLHLDDFIRATATLRLLCIVGLIMIIADVLSENRQGLDLGHHVEVFLVATVVVLLSSVAIPQPCANYVGERLLARVLPALRAINLIARPTIGVVMQLCDSLVRRLAGVPKSNGQSETEQIEEEVLHAVNEAELQGAVDKQEKAMIKSVMKLDESTVEEIMTPRTEVVAIRKDASLQDIKELIKKEGHSRIPVYEENVDGVLGMVYAKDLLHVPEDEPFDLMQHIREVPFVPETKPVGDLLQEFRTGKTHVALVVDEYGGTAGLVTIEDILEELVGEITDEYEPPEPEPILQIGKQAIEVDSRVHVDEINELLEMNLPESDDYETIGGLVFSTLGKIPEPGEQLVCHNVRITILEAEDRKINRLRIEATPQQAEL